MLFFNTQEISKKTVGVVLFSVQNGKVYFSLMCDHSGKWGFPLKGPEGDEKQSETNLRVISCIKEVLGIDVSDERVRSVGDFDYHTTSESDEGRQKVSFYYVETGHTPLHLVSKNTFDDTKWFLLEDAVHATLADGVLPVLKKVEYDVHSRLGNGSKNIIKIIVSLAVFLIIGFIIGTKIIDISKDTATQKKDKERHDAFYAGILKNDPKLLQAAFVEDIKNGVNDKYTKSDAYFVTHRYFDNGGNIYEIYDYINNHQELGFINREAEKLYPVAFARIKNGTMSRAFTDASAYAYLAYVEVLYNHGYTDVAALSTLANQYVKMAYYNTSIAKEMPKKEGQERAEYARRDASKALRFLKIAEPQVRDVVYGSKKASDVVPRDVLVGVNQYAAAVRYFEGLKENGLSTTTPITSLNSNDLFSFAMEYSRRSVPELALFTSLLNGSTLALLSSSTPQEIKTALYPIIDFNTKTGNLSQNSIIHKILNSRFEPKPKNVGDTNMDIYSKRNTLRLAKKVPEFKTWLMYNGWKETDFK